MYVWFSNFSNLILVLITFKSHPTNLLPNTTDKVIDIVISLAGTPIANASNSVGTLLLVTE